jgi:hypothetical protein
MGTLAVVRDDDVLEDDEGARGEADAVFTHHELGLVVEHDGAVDDVADEFAVVCVSEALVVGEFAGLAEIVEEEAHHHDVAVDLGVQGAHGVRELEQVQGVLEQAAEVGVVDALRGGGSLEGGDEDLVGEVDLGEGLHRGVFEGVEEAEEFGEHVLGGTLRAGHEVAEFVVAGLDLLDPLDDELDLALVGLGFAFEEDEALAGHLEVLVDGPEAAGHFAGAVADEAAKVGLLGAGAAELGVQDGVDALDPLGALHFFDELTGGRGGLWRGCLGHGGSVRRAGGRERRRFPGFPARGYTGRKFPRLRRIVLQAGADCVILSDGRPLHF